MTLSCYSIPAMEKEEENKDMFTSPEKASSTPATPLRSRKRSSVLMRFGRAVLFMARRPSSTLKKVTPAQVDAVVRSGRTSLWKCLASGMRPLHHQLEHQEAAAPVKVLPAALRSLTKVGSFHDVFTPAASPLHSTSVDGTSTYASPKDLRALDACEDGERDAKRDDGDNGEPNEIDIKAEEFIARFYEQQRLESIALQGV